VPELPRLRLSSIDPAAIDDELGRLIAEEPRLMPHLHLSIQAGSDLILKRMKRRHLRADVIAVARRARDLRPGIVFGADLIAGFPTETEAAFDNSLALVEAAGLAYLHVFPFSPRPDTPAALMPPLPRAIVKARAERLRAAGAAGLRRHLDRQLGRTVTALVETPGLARAEDFTEVAFDPAAAAPGEIVQLIVERHDGRRAFARPVRG
jgi:threonylcarbamoyladenosine tRNA methylthiotransferase MtaB